MKSCSLFLALSLLALGGGCRKSEIDEKPAAEVSTTVSAETATTTQPAAGAVTANVIKEKSAIEFVAAKVTRDHKGKFTKFDGWIEYVNGAPSRISFDIDLTSIETDTGELTEHLKTPDFFDVATHPKATFTSMTISDPTAAQPVGTTHVVKGVLDLHGVKKEVTIPVTAHVAAAGVHTQSEFTINRHDWGISYKGVADDLIKDEVLIRLNLQFPPPPAAGDSRKPFIGNA